MRKLQNLCIRRPCLQLYLPEEESHKDFLWPGRSKSLSYSAILEQSDMRCLVDTKPWPRELNIEPHDVGSAGHGVLQEMGKRFRIELLDNAWYFGGNVTQSALAVAAKIRGC